MSSYMLIHGDCMDSFGLIHDHSVNLVLADPPYGITQNTWDVVLPFDDFIECDGKNLNYEKYSEPFFFSNTIDIVYQIIGNLLRQHLAPILYAPNDMIVQIVNTGSCVYIRSRFHTYIISYLQ